MKEDTPDSTILACLRHLWFLLDVAAKSMTQAILTNCSHKYSRRRRFSSLTLEAMDNMFAAVAHQILCYHQRCAPETRAANVALAYFAKHCLNIVDRGSLYTILYELVKKYDLNDVGVSRFCCRFL